MMKHVFAVAAVTLLAVACWTPASNPTSSDYPCGPRGRVCADRQCCWANEDCGGETPGCPQDMCCYAGDPWNTLAARRPAHKKWVSPTPAPLGRSDHWPTTRHVLDVMWMRTKPEVRAECEALALRVVGRVWK